MGMVLNKPKKLKRAPIFKINGETILRTPTLKYLGIILDNNLTFLPHLKQQKDNMIQLTQNILKFASHQGGHNKRILKLWYTTILQKKIAYGCSIWYPRMQRTNSIRCISSIQYRCLLLITRAYNKTSKEALCVLAGIPPLELQLKEDSTAGRVLRLGIPVDGHFPDIYQPKASKNTMDPSLELQAPLPVHPDHIIQIYTDGSKTEQGTGYAFCAFKGELLLAKEHYNLQHENSVYQAELLAILAAIRWSITSEHLSFEINTDSLSGLLAIEKLNSEDQLVYQIRQLVVNTHKSFKFNWVRGHTGVAGNEMADKLAKEATDPTIAEFKFFPLPQSHLKYILKKATLTAWQQRWSEAATGRFTYRLKPKVDKSTLLPHRNLYIFATNHGPFPAYLHQINSQPSPNCSCGGEGTVLHYILSCPLTRQFHVQKPNSLSTSNWFSLLLKSQKNINKIISCITELECNQFLYQGIGAAPVQTEEDDSDL